MTIIDIAAGATAFGDGSHPTTQGVLAALKAMDPVIFAPRNACDMGAGSGILTFAVIEKFRCPVIAVDMMADAVATVKENAARNHVAALVSALQADGFDHPAITTAVPFDLIIMNILAEPLLKLAGDAERHLATDGVLILSGILQWQEAQIREAYNGLGLELTFRVVLGDWVTLVWQKP